MKISFDKKSNWFSSLKTGAFRSTASMTLGSGFAQTINFFFTAYLARIYTPSDFGAMATFVSISSLISVVSTGKYDIALVVSKSKQESIHLFRLSVWISLLVSLTFFLFLLFFKTLILPHLNTGTDYGWFYLMPIYIFLLSAVQIAWMYNVREKSFGDLSVIRIFDPLITGVFSLLLIDLGALGLILGLLAGQASMASILISRIYSRDHFHPLKTKVMEMIIHAKRYADFPKFNILQGFGDSLLSTGIILVGSAIYSPQTIGLLSISLRVLQAPMGLVIKPLSHVFFSRASEEWRAGNNILPLCIKSIKATTLIASLLPITMLLLGPTLFEFVFGEQWREAGTFARVLSFWLFLDLIKAPLAQIPAIVGKQKSILVWTLIANMILVFVILLSGKHFSTLKSLIVITVYQCIQCLFFIFLFLVIPIQKPKNDH